MKSIFIRFGLFTLLMVILVIGIFAQNNEGISNPQKFALVIGNGAYTGLSRLTNPVNDANDIAAVLQSLGFTVEKVLNGNLDEMESAVMRLRNRLTVDQDSYGFFFYAGHGVQSGGDNYLIPVDSSIPSETYLRTRAVSVQVILDDLNEARNTLNVVILDACRDNPFGWGRSGTRGLAIMSRQPADSIIVYATSAGQQASDGSGRNGLFTSKLLPNLMASGMEVTEVFRRTGAEVAEESERRQIPAIYNQFFGTAYFNGIPDGTGAAVPVRPVPSPLPSTNERDGKADKTAQLWTVGASAGTSFADPWMITTLHGTIAPIKNYFLELGFDLGLVSGKPDVNYYSLYPYANVAYFRPFAEKGGWYAGAGAGYLIAEYKFTQGNVPLNIFALNITAGINLFDMLDISYTLRTNFEVGSNKISVGYTYRFR